jgi:hypothetical protein
MQFENMTYAFLSWVHASEEKTSRNVVGEEFALTKGAKGQLTKPLLCVFSVNIPVMLTIRHPEDEKKGDISRHSSKQTYSDPTTENKTLPYMTQLTVYHFLVNTSKIQ